MLKSKKRKISQKSKELEELLNRPEKMVYLVLAVWMSVFSCLLIIDWESSALNVTGALPVQKQHIPVVKGESVRSELSVREELQQEYEKKLRFILEDYLILRLDNRDKHIQAWLAANLKTQEQILNLRIPEDYRKLHLELLVILNQEAEILGRGDPSDPQLIQTDSRFREVFKHYNFLN